MIQIAPLDAHELRWPVSFRRVNHTDIVEVAIAWLQDVGLIGCDQCRRISLGFFYDTPICHFRVAGSQAIDRPAGAMVVRRTVRSVLVDMATNAEAQLRILVQNLARATLFGGQVIGDEFLIE